MKGDREGVRRNSCRTDLAYAINRGGIELGIEPELPGVVHIARIVGLSVRPDQVGSQMKRPGGGISIDTAILYCGDFARRPRVNYPLRVTVEERQEQCLIDQIPDGVFAVAIIGNERNRIFYEGFSPGASANNGGSGGTTACVDHPKVSQQAHTAQDTSRDDHDHQSNQQHRTASRYPPGLPLYRHGWLQGRGHNRSRGGNQWAPLRRLVGNSAFGCVMTVLHSGAWVHGRLECSYWQIGRKGHLRG